MDLGFGRASGPNPSTRPVAPTFGHSLRPPSRSPPTPPFPASAPLRSPRGPGVLEKVQSPPSAFEHSGHAVSPAYQASPRVLRPASFSTPLHNQPNLPGAYANFLAHQDQSSVSPYLGSYASGRKFSTDHDGVQVLKRNRSPPLSSGSEVLQEDSHFAPNDPRRPASFSNPLHNQPNSPGSYANFLAHQDQSSVSPHLGSYASGRKFSTDHDGVQVLKRNRSPSLPPGSEVLPENSHFAPNGPRRAPGALERRLSPPLAFESTSLAVTPVYQNSPGVRRPSISPPMMATMSNFVSTTDSQIHQKFSTSAINPVSGVVATEHTSPPANKRTRSPSLLPNDQLFPKKFYSTQDGIAEREMQAKAKRLARFKVESSENVQCGPDFTDQKVSTTRSGQSIGNYPPELPRDFTNAHVLSVSGVVATEHTSPPAVKRTRSPSLLPNDQPFPEKSYSTQDGITEREMQAKAKRLARFKVELSENVQRGPDFTDPKVSTTRSEQSIGNYPPELPRDFTNAHVLSDYDGSESSNIITGLCPDMCPESERAERERKGDLDQHERVDGDRNQTSKFLAVKKYTRTAEREASLIRPMPVLQKTIDYLLNLLDLPYDDRFLGIYNFLWDRMRAIRMDLRMQHIFNQGAIVMLEQMIRLHIIVMHELCEHTKGEGFSEGFDAHLNIEQMNKTSVELFQIYDDHRKKGINVPTEREFRGYYALLKLDKHPGYKVEAAELSLDLAKMTPEIRQTPEVLFARDVARSCRTGNFIAFFRLARRASYLQACLMHAHFAKLRTQALASLHSGLQLNQGIPVSHVAMWLGMEEEDIESLLQYHGFSIKIFEEPYMMKEGLFCNRSKDYPTKCSVLVHLKKSRRIIEDFSPLTPAEFVSIPSVESESYIHTSNEEMADLEGFSSSRNGPQQQPIVISPTVSKQGENDLQAAGASTSPQGFLLSYSSPKPQLAKVGILWKPNCDESDLSRNSLERNDVHFHREEMPLQIVSNTTLQERSSDGIYDYAVEKCASPTVLINSLEDAGPSDTHEENKISQVMPHDHDKETAEAKLKLILRLWKRCCTKRREFREQRQVAANAALDSLSLGPPIRQKKDQQSNSGELDIDHVIGERYKKHVESWSRLNVSDVIAGILSRRNPEAKCLCWKLIVCSQMNNLEGVKLGQRSQVARLHAAWLLPKLMPSSTNESNDDLIISSPGLSMWRKWVPNQYGAYVTCCLSIVKDAEFANLGETVSGASAVLFLVSENIPWKHQKFQLQNLLMSIPSGSCLPLLILSCSYKEETPESFSIIVNELGLHDIDKSRISSFQVVPLIVNHQMEQSDGFFSDEQLREGLKWLASKSPRQPVLHNVKTRELVLSHLNSSLEVLERKNDYEVGPNDCISAFNEALDWSFGNIAAAAKANPAGWPCPEIALLEESSDEHRMVKWHLPTIGWNCLEKIEPLMYALRDSKLPAFTDDISWLGRGSYMGKEIKNQKLELENCLVRYLTQASKMMRFAEAMKEACIMLQQGASIELHNTCFCIVPSWTMIFRRIFHWRLMNLSSGVFSKAYILECQIAAPISGDIEMLQVEGSSSSPYYMDHPSLDEVIEVVCSSLLLGGVRSRPDALEPLSGSVRDGQVHEATGHDGDLAITTDVEDNTGTEIVVAGVTTMEMDNLNKLLGVPKMSAYERSRILLRFADLVEKHSDELAALETWDNGKPYEQSAKAEIPMLVRLFHYYAGWADKIHGLTVPADGNYHVQTLHEPIGVAGQIIPWNFPLLMFAWKVGPALACGNAIVLKTAEQTPLTALYVAKLFQDAGLPPGVLNVVSGFGPTAGAALASHMDVDKLAFTGSTDTGKIILELSARSNLKPVTLELGGKSPFIVCEDADVDKAVELAHFALFFNQGQCCCAGSRTYVHERIYDEFIEKAKARAIKRVVGDPFKKGVEQGPQIDPQQFEKILRYIRSGIQSNATLECGGDRIGSKGYFIQPTVFSNVQDDMLIAKDEIFGPVQSILKFKDLDEVIRRANTTRYGLAAGVFTRSLDTANTLTRALRAGTVWVNCFDVFDAAIPFGGYKMSGIGREKGIYSLQNYLQVKAIVTPLHKPAWL